MIRPLRRRHRWMVAAVAVVVVPIFLAALEERPERPLQERLPLGVEESPPPPGVALELELPTEPSLRVRAWPEAGVLAVEAREAVEGAGLLLYWVPIGAEFPDQAVLVGAVRGHGRQVLALPRAAAEAGALVLYSLGHGEEMARAAWPGASGR